MATNNRSNTIDRNSLPWRPAVGIALFNREGKVFMGERIDNPGKWQMPQGGMEAGETVAQSALRELREETGITRASILKIADQTIHYELPDELVIKLWQGKYRGQAQTWVAARFDGTDRDIDIHGESRGDVPPEFSAWQWVGLEDSLGLVVPYVRDPYRKVIAMFSDYAEEYARSTNPVAG